MSVPKFDYYYYFFLMLVIKDMTGHNMKAVLCKYCACMNMGFLILNDCCCHETHRISTLSFNIQTLNVLNRAQGLDTGQALKVLNPLLCMK